MTRELTNLVVRLQSRWRHRVDEREPVMEALRRLGQLREAAAHTGRGPQARQGPRFLDLQQLLQVERLAVEPGMRSTTAAIPWSPEDCDAFLASLGLVWRSRLGVLIDLEVASASSDAVKNLDGHWLELASAYEDVVRWAAQTYRQHAVAIAALALRVPRLENWLARARQLESATELLEPSLNADAIRRITEQVVTALRQLDEAELVCALAAPLAEALSQFPGLEEHEPGITSQAVTSFRNSYQRFQEELDECIAWLNDHSEVFDLASSYVVALVAGLREDLEKLPDLAMTVWKFEPLMQPLCWGEGLQEMGMPTALAQAIGQQIERSNQASQARDAARASPAKSAEIRPRKWQKNESLFWIALCLPLASLVVITWLWQQGWLTKDPRITDTSSPSPKPLVTGGLAPDLQHDDIQKRFEDERNRRLLAEEERRRHEEAQGPRGPNGPPKEEEQRRREEAQRRLVEEVLLNAPIHVASAAYAHDVLGGLIEAAQHGWGGSSRLRWISPDDRCQAVLRLQQDKVIVTFYSNAEERIARLVGRELYLAGVSGKIGPGARAEFDVKSLQEQYSRGENLYLEVGTERERWQPIGR